MTLQKTNRTSIMASFATLKSLSDVCSSSPSLPEEELHRAILKAVQDLAANFTDEVAAQINGILHDIQTGESTKPNLQELLEQTRQ